MFNLWQKDAGGVFGIMFIEGIDSLGEPSWTRLKPCTRKKGKYNSMLLILIFSVCFEMLKNNLITIGQLITSILFWLSTFGHVPDSHIGGSNKTTWKKGNMHSLTIRSFFLWGRKYLRMHNYLFVNVKEKEHSKHKTYG